MAEVAATVVLNESFERPPNAVAAESLGPSPEPESQSLHLPAEIFDLTALASAFVASLAVAPMLAFSYDDIKGADSRYSAFWANRSSGLGDGAQVVSEGLAASTSSSLALCVVSLIASLVVRMGLHLAEKLATEPMAAVRKMLVPLEVFAILALLAGLIVATFSYYWSGWVVYAENLVGNTKWTIVGIAVIISLVAMSLYAAGVVAYIYRHGFPAKPVASSAAPRAAPQAGAKAHG
jgi:hypothetical protein